MPRKTKQQVKVNNNESLEKLCNKCSSVKLLCEFTKSKTSFDGYRNTCKKCTNSNKDNEKYKTKQKEYRIKNSDTKIKYMSQYNSKPEVKERVKKWVEVNRESINEKRKQYKKTIPHIISWRNLLSHSINRLGQTKQGSTHKLLGYSALDLKYHIESLFTDGMSWSNYGEWHIDHIKPVSSFTRDTLPSIVNSLNNLQPLWATTREINGVVYEGNLNKNNNVLTKTNSNAS